MHIVYILSSLVAKKSYVGMTDDLDRRLLEHNSGKSKYTSSYAPWKVIYEEKHQSLADARNREKYFKSTSGRRLLKKIFSIIED